MVVCKNHQISEGTDGQDLTVKMLIFFLILISLSISLYFSCLVNQATGSSVGKVSFCHACVAGSPVVEDYSDALSQDLIVDGTNHVNETATPSFGRLVHMT